MPRTYNKTEFSRRSYSSRTYLGGSFDSYPFTKYWLQRLSDAGFSQPSQGIIDSVIAFEEILTKFNLINKILRFNFFNGPSFNSIFVPFIVSNEIGTVIGANSDQNNGPFVSGDWSASTGLQCDGFTKYLNTFFPTNELDIATGAGIGCRISNANSTGVSAYPLFMGSASGNNHNNLFLGRDTPGGFYFFYFPNTSSTRIAHVSSDYSTLLYGQVKSGINPEMYMDGAIADYGSPTTQNFDNATYILVGTASYYNPNFSAANQYTAGTISTYFIINGFLNSYESFILSNAINSLNIAFGRS